MDVETKQISITVILLLGLIGGCMYGCPKYDVWQKRLAGQSELARADYSRQIAVVEATAKEAAAKSLANAEVTRAGGVAEANKIIGDSLKNNEAYLRYLYVNGLAEKDNNVYYIPTEAGLPILEAGHR